MQILRHRLELATDEPIQIIDLTERIRGWVAGSGIVDGLLTVSSPHTTARINVNEREPQLALDMVAFLQRLAPAGAGYGHDHAPVDDRPNAHAHLLGLLMSSAQTVPVAGGVPVLGGWQAIFFIELDGPRERRSVALQLLGQGGRPANPSGDRPTYSSDEGPA
jgi:secondary thiamine-phosphate synthase enzyme